MSRGLRMKKSYDSSCFAATTWHHIRMIGKINGRQLGAKAAAIISRCPRAATHAYEAQAQPLPVPVQPPQAPKPATKPKLKLDIAEWITYG